jgi:hypothetical protein
MNTSITSGQMVNLLTLAEQKGLNPELTQPILTSGILADIFESAVAQKIDPTHRDDIRELLGLSRLTPKPVITAYMVDIGFLTTEEGVAAGKYDYQNPNVTSENFPVKGNQGKKEVSTVHFGRRMESLEEVIAELDKLGFRPAETADLLAFGKDQSEIQLQYPVIALGSSATVDGYRCAPFLGKSDSKRGLFLSYWALGWHGSYRFLAVRK